MNVPWDHPAAMFLASLSSGSRRAQLDCLRRVGRFFGLKVGEIQWTKLNFGEVSMLRGWLAETFSPATANATLSAVRGVLRTASRLGLVSRELAHAAADVGTVRGSRVKPGRALSREEIRRLFECCEDRGPAGVRDAALLAVLYGAGLRRAEAKSLNWDDWHTIIEERQDDTGNVIRVEVIQLLVRGKGNKERIVPLPDRSTSLLRRWLECRGSLPGPMFYSIQPRRGFSPHGITEAGIYGLLLDLAERARVDRFTPHDLRRSYISDLLDLGVDAKTVGDLVGHADMATTSRYDRRPAYVRRKAVQKLEVP